MKYLPLLLLLGCSTSAPDAWYCPQGMICTMQGTTDATTADTPFPGDSWMRNVWNSADPECDALCLEYGLCGWNAELKKCYPRDDKDCGASVECDAHGNCFAMPFNTGLCVQWEPARNACTAWHPKSKPKDGKCVSP